MADVELRGVTKRYGASVAVDRVDLKIAKGELVSLLGPSGSGKTTLLRMIAGLVEVSAGEIYIQGRAVASIPVHRRGLAMMFQNYALFPHMTVAQNIAFGLEMRRTARGQIAARIAEVVDLVRLKGLEGRFPRQLSGGQQQRVALARCLAISPDVLLLDEPLGALDKKLRERMQVELRTLQRQVGITTIFVTHDQEEALTLSDRIAIMNEGRLEQIGTPLEIYEAPATRFVSDFVGVCNFLEVELQGTTGEGDALFQTEGGLRLAVPQSALEGHWNSRVTVAIRPEKIEIASGPSSGSACNEAAGEVTEVVYLGTITQYHVRIHTGDPMIVYQQNSEAQLLRYRFRRGDGVVLRWPGSAIRVLAE